MFSICTKLRIHQMNYTWLLVIPYLCSHADHLRKFRDGAPGGWAARRRPCAQQRALHTSFLLLSCKVSFLLSHLNADGKLTDNKGCHDA